MDNLEKKLQVLLILGLTLGLLAADVNSSSEDQEASELIQPPIQLTHEEENISSDGYALENLDDSFTEETDQNEGIFDDILKEVFETTKDETAKNPAYAFENFDSMFSYIDGGLDFINQTKEDNSTLSDYLQQGIDFLPNYASNTPIPLNASQFPHVSMYNLSSYDNTTVNETATNSADIPENFDSIFKYINDGLDFFNETREDNSTLIDYQQQNFDFLPSSIASSPVSLNTSSKFQDVSMHNLPSHKNAINTSVNKTSGSPAYTLKSEFVGDTTPAAFVKQQTINQNLSKPRENLVTIENNTDFIKNDKEYTVILPRICSNNSIINRFMHLLNVSPNNKKTANFTCENIRDIQIKIKSKEIFDNINEFLRAEAKTDDMIFIKVTPNDTLSFEVLPQSSFHGVFIPMFVVYIIGFLLLWLIVVIICICAHKKVCRRNSTSLDLHDIPHLNLKMDYNLTPIPRPSISFPDTNREFLHAYPQDNYKSPRQENTLNKTTSSSTVAKIYDEVDKEMCHKRELSTFVMSTDRKSEAKASTSQDYSWNSLREMNYAKKYGVENAAYKKW